MVADAENQNRRSNEKGEASGYVHHSQTQGMPLRQRPKEYEFNVPPSSTSFEESWVNSSEASSSDFSSSGVESYRVSQM